MIDIIVGCGDLGTLIAIKNSQFKELIESA